MSGESRGGWSNNCTWGLCSVTSRIDCFEQVDHLVPK